MASRLGRIAARYSDLTKIGSVTADAAQELAVRRLDRVLDRLHTAGPTACKGLYLHGSVGIGKSFLMDMAFELADTGDSGKQRWHFHSFMLEVHRKLHHARQQCAWGQGGNAPDIVAEEIANSGRLLCFDEFQVTDIADAMILRGLFHGLWQRDVVMIATSNREPSRLYEGGLNRYHFLPFIDELQMRCEVHRLDGMQDYRLTTKAEPGLFLHPHNALAEAQLAELFDELGEMGGSKCTLSCELESGSGRTIFVPRAKMGIVCWFTFAELCATPTGAADFAALAQQYDTIILSEVPILNSRDRNEARRFITLIDAAYEHGVRLVCSAEAPIDDLFTALTLEVVADENEEENLTDNGVCTTAKAYWPGSDQISNAPPVTVQIAQNSRSTTFVDSVHGTMEWSATGRMQVSLAELASVREVAFAFQRATSRLHEMQGASYARRRDQW